MSLKKWWRFWVMALSDTLKEMGVGEIIQEMVGGSMTSLLAAHYHFAPRSELPELLFIALIGGIAGPLLGFLFRLFLITPAKMHREIEKKAEKSELKLEGLLENTRPLIIEAIVFEMNIQANHFCRVKIVNPSKATQANHLKVDLVSIEPLPKMAQLPKQDIQVNFPVRLKPKAGDTWQINPHDHVFYDLFIVKQAGFQLEIEFLTDDRFKTFETNFSLIKVDGKGEIVPSVDEFILTISASAEFRSPTIQKFKMAFSDKPGALIVFL
jgi:hypothetical protein